MKQEQNQFILKISISIFLVLLLTTLLALFSILLKNYSNNKLQKEVHAILSETYGNTLVFKETIDFKNTSTSLITTYLYEYSEKKLDSENLYAFCFSLTGLSGPVPVLYVVKGKNEPEFVGILASSLKEKNPLLYGLTSSVIEFGKEIVESFFNSQNVEGAL